MHMYLEKGKFYGGNGIVGAQIPLGAGLAFAHKFRKDGGVAVAAMGDGASNQGQVRRRYKLSFSFLFLFFPPICCTIVKHSR
jgi:pyruvate dehydrogenase E1 component alpha subunit